MTRLFGTDGVRGVANNTLSPELALNLGRSAALVLAEKCPGPIYVGRDTRISGQMLEAALVAGITSAGVEAVLLGEIPTPGVAHLTRREGAAGGVVISASHNPMPDNGIKFFSGDGFKLPDAVEDRIAAGLGEQRDLPTGAGVGRVVADNEAWKRYGQFLVGLGESLSGLRLVVDCAHGAAWQVAPWVFRELGAECTVIHASPNGTNINERCGSTHLDSLQAAVITHKADVGLAFDGDADRVLAVDEEGQVVDGDHILAICGLEMLRVGQLVKKTMVATVYSNLGLQLALEKAGGRLITTQAGDRYVLEAMVEEGVTLGGEQSGHIIFLDHVTTGDGILSALKLLKVVKNSSGPLSELASVMTAVPQRLVNVRVHSKVWQDNDSIQAALAEATERMAHVGRIFVRASGTEPLLRVLVEGLDSELVEETAKNVAAVIQKELG